MRELEGHDSVEVWLHAVEQVRVKRLFECHEDLLVVAVARNLVLSFLNMKYQRIVKEGLAIAGII